MSTPNARSKALLEAEGYRVELVERYNSWAQTRHDLFNVFDLLAVGHGRTVAVQATTNSNLAARRTKLLKSDAVPICIAAGWHIEVHGWARRGRNWQARRVQINAENI